MRTLIVEDDKGISRFIRKGLSDEGCGVDADLFLKLVIV